MNSDKRETLASQHSLRYERERRGWSQSKVAEQIGSTPDNISRWERGVTRPSPHFREQLCRLFEKNTEELGLFISKDEETSIEEPSHSGLLSSIHDSVIPFPLPTGLIGRDMLFSQIREQLSRHQTSVALHGLPGAGKTALAITLAHDETLLDAYDGVLWAGLGPQPRLFELLRHWGDLLGIDSSPHSPLTTYEGWEKAIRMAIGTRRFLLVIDDAWTIEDALVFKVGGPRCSHLVTTRFPQIALRFAPTNEFVIHELDEENGLALLSHLAPEITELGSKHMHDLVHLVGGLPLALSLVGKYIHEHAYTHQTRRIASAVEQLYDPDTRLDLSDSYAQAERPPSFSTKTHISLQDIVKLSDQQLEESAHRALCALSVFPAKPYHFSEEAAAAVCQVPVEVFDVLTDTGLLEVSGPQRYTMHQVITDYARAHLTDDQVEIRMINYFLQFAEKYKHDEEHLTLESRMIILAFERAFERKLYTRAFHGIYTFLPFLLSKGLYTVAESLLRQCYASALTLGDSENQAKALLNLGKTLQRQGKLSEAKTTITQGLPLTHLNPGTRQSNELRTRLLLCLGAIEGSQGNFSEARNTFEEGLAFVQKTHIETMKSRFLMNLGVTLADQGKYDEARRYFQEELSYARQSDDSERISLLLLNNGWVACELGVHKQSEMYLQEGLTLARQAKNTDRIQRFLVNLGQCMLNKGEEERAEEYLQASLLLAQNLGNSWLIASSLTALGELDLKQKALKKANSTFFQALAVVPAEIRLLKARIYYGIAQIAAHQRNILFACNMCRKSVEILNQIGHQKTFEVQSWLKQLCISIPIY